LIERAVLVVGLDFIEDLPLRLLVSSEPPDLPLHRSDPKQEEVLASAGGFPQTSSPALTPAERERRQKTTSGLGSAPVPSPEESLRTAVRRYEQEKIKLDERAARNTAKRDEAIRKAHASGLTMREIAKIAGVSHQRVYQVVKGD
jgi:hypothetical protein